MKAIIIENERSIPDSIEYFLKQHPDLFESVETLFYARHRPEIVVEALKGEVDSVIVSSTFIHKQQLEDSVSLLSKFPNLTFYLVDAAETLNHITRTFLGRPEDAYAFKSFEKFEKTIKEWVADGRVFSIRQDIGSGQIPDPWISEKVSFDMEAQIFYDGELDRNWIDRKRKQFHHM